MPFVAVGEVRCAWRLIVLIRAVLSKGLRDRRPAPGGCLRPSGVDRWRWQYPRRSWRQGVLATCRLPDAARTRGGAGTAWDGPDGARRSSPEELFQAGGQLPG